MMLKFFSLILIFAGSSSAGMTKRQRKAMKKYEEARENPLRSRLSELPDVVDVLKIETDSIYEWVESNIRKTSNSRRVLAALNKFEQKFEAIFNEHGYLLCKTKDSSRLDAFGFFDDFVEEAASEENYKESFISFGKGEAPLSRFEAASNDNGFSHKYVKLQSILERIRDKINKFTNVCAKHSNFLERVYKIENRGVNALLSEILSS